MKIGIITDVHNNLIALKTVVEYFEQQKCEKIVCCGDIIGIGPYPEETVQYMRKLPNLIAVKGNHDKYLTEGMPEEYPNEEQMDYGEMRHHEWEHARLSEKSVAFLKTLPERADIVVEEYKIAIMHYCMDDTGRYVPYVPNPSDGDLESMLAHIDSDIVPMELIYDTERVVAEINRLDYPEAENIKKFFYGM